MWWPSICLICMCPRNVIFKSMWHSLRHGSLLSNQCFQWLANNYLCNTKYLRRNAIPWTAETLVGTCWWKVLFVHYSWKCYTILLWILQSIQDRCYISIVSSISKLLGLDTALNKDTLQLSLCKNCLLSMPHKFLVVLNLS